MVSIMVPIRRNARPGDIFYDSGNRRKYRLEIQVKAELRHTKACLSQYPTSVAALAQ
jgi:hypothetical protein